MVSVLIQIKVQNSWNQSEIWRKTMDSLRKKRAGYDLLAINEPWSNPSYFVWAIKSINQFIYLLSLFIFRKNKIVPRKIAYHVIQRQPETSSSNSCIRRAKHCSLWRTAWFREHCLYLIIMLAKCFQTLRMRLYYVTCFHVFTSALKWKIESVFVAFHLRSLPKSVSNLQHTRL